MPRKTQATTRRPRADHAPTTRALDAALDAWATQYAHAGYDATLHHALGRFVKQTLTTRSIVDPFTIPLA